MNKLGDKVTMTGGEIHPSKHSVYLPNRLPEVLLWWDHVVTL